MTFTKIDNNYITITFSIRVTLRKNIKIKNKQINNVCRRILTIMSFKFILKRVILNNFCILLNVYKFSIILYVYLICIFFKFLLLLFSLIAI